MEKSSLRLRVTVEPSEAVLATANLADTSWRRMRGLLGHDGLEAGAGLVLRPCNLIHTWFMRFPIDVLFADRQGYIVGVHHTVTPFRFAWGGWRACLTVELPAGALRHADVTVGQRVRLEPPQ